MKGRVKFFSPQNTAGVSQEKGASVISQTIAVNVDQISNAKKFIVKPRNASVLLVQSNPSVL